MALRRSPQEARQATTLTQGGHALPPSGEDLVRVGLVPHIPHQPIAGGLKHVMQSDCQLHHAQTRGQVTAGLGD